MKHHIRSPSESHRQEKPEKITPLPKPKKPDALPKPKKEQPISKEKEKAFKEALRRDEELKAKRKEEDGKKKALKEAFEKKEEESKKKREEESKKFKEFRENLKKNPSKKKDIEIYGNFPQQNAMDQPTLVKSKSETTDSKPVAGIVSPIQINKVEQNVKEVTPIVKEKKQPTPRGDQNGDNCQYLDKCYQKLGEVHGEYLRMMEEMYMVNH